MERRDDAIAITYAQEDAIGPHANAQVQHVTWKQLRIQVASYAAALRAEGVQVGDRVAGTSKPMLACGNNFTLRRISSYLDKST